MKKTKYQKFIDFLEPTENDEMYTITFNTRNKDNPSIEGFRERRESFCFDGDKERLLTRFQEFVKRGKQGEVSRLYISINKRSKKETKKDLQIALIEQENLNICRIESKIASLSMAEKNRLSNNWLIDFDGNEEELEQLIKEIKEKTKEQDLKTVNPIIEIYKTKNNYALITKRFDIREIEQKYKDILENKRDGYICASWGKNE